jgi:hypothetical protein
MGKPEDYRNLSGISSDDAQLKARIAQNFGEWWRRVCTPDSTLKDKLSKESKDKKDAPSGIDVLTSEQLYLATRLSLMIARATQYMDVVALFQALGGGWWNRSDIEEPKDGGLSSKTRVWPAQ